MAQRSTARVLYIHGLESGPWGAKAMALKKHFKNVKSVDMEVSLWRLNRRNSLARCMLVSMSATIVATGTITTALTYAQPSLAISTIGGLTTLFFMARYHALPRAVERMLNSATSIQTKAIASFKPDLIVGSSFGGAVACHLIAQQRWSGPTLLLAPAYLQILNRARRELCDTSMQALKRYSDQSNVLIVHSDNDTTVPPADAVALHRMLGSSSQLKALAYDDHRLKEYGKSGSIVDDCNFLLEQVR
eukprot:TRINITY_DN3024_c0_g1_i2.p1 TRINITY_DN3024_c0_g1~~TRINITY_DN3024_c0_g1_i2.p1  ORF type:complete len:247 (+),score=23.68 TRINITY_DN3024_c0_g1_i2:3-743(+)